MGCRSRRSRRWQSARAFLLHVSADFDGVRWSSTESHANLKQQFAVLVDAPSGRMHQRRLLVQRRALSSIGGHLTRLEDLLS